MSDISFSQTIHRLAASPLAAELALKFLPLATAGDGVPKFLEQSLAEIRATTKADTVVVARGERGHWRKLAAQGGEPSLPTELFADVLDRNAAVSAGT